MESCAAKHSNNDQGSEKLVFEEKELKCTMNCIQKYKTSMNLAMGLLQIESEERGLTDN